MVNIPANMTQVLNNSPQVTSLVAGEAGAADQIRRMRQLEESKRLEEQMRSKVAASEKSVKPGESEEEIRRKPEERNQKLAVSDRRGGRGRSRAAAKRAAREAETPPREISPFESRQVIDVCV